MRSCIISVQPCYEISTQYKFRLQVWEVHTNGQIVQKGVLLIASKETNVLFKVLPCHLHITYIKGCWDVKHHFIHLSRHPSGRMQLCHPHYLK